MGGLVFPVTLAGGGFVGQQIYKRSVEKKATRLQTDMELQETS